MVRGAACVRRKQRPKWLLPSGYVKERRLFNIDGVRPFSPIVIVTEGIWHVLACERAGIPAVAAFGSAPLSGAQVKLLA